MTKKVQLFHEKLILGMIWNEFVVTGKNVHQNSNINTQNLQKKWREKVFLSPF